MDGRIKDTGNGIYCYSANGSPVIAGGCLYLVGADSVREGAVIRCYDADTGKEMYAENVGPAISSFASPFATADGLVYFASSGKSTIIKAGPKFELVAVNDLGDGEFAPPVYAQLAAELRPREIRL
jgi:outer membrane protein assembly factor BamB